jgi:hypothetical protein
MKRRIHSSLQPRQRHFDFDEFQQTKSRLIASGRTNGQNDESAAVGHGKVGRSASMAPSSLQTSANFLRMIGYSPQRMAPALRVKAATFISNKPFYLQPE